MAATFAFVLIFQGCFAIASFTLSGLSKSAPSLDRHVSLFILDSTVTGYSLASASTTRIQ